MNARNNERRWKIKEGKFKGKLNIRNNKKEKEN